MKTKLKALVGLLTISISSVVQAEASYAGIQYGNLKSEDAGMTNIAFSVGTNILDSKHWGVEANYTRTVNADKLGGGQELESDGYAFYLVGRSEGQFYAKARLGVGRINFDRTGSSINDVRGGSSDLSYGIGVGADLKESFVELEYTQLPTLKSFNGAPANFDNQFLSLGLMVKF